ncbi:MAG: lipopolysaccharide heptosyltransferase II [Gammaproteobacteria bacterium]|nr:lipopolysaccharide heptosyltransferase II [Gammaproteobacteria bacterium]
MVAPGPPTPTVTNLLIVGPAWVGDMVLAQCLFKAIRRADPAARITVLAPAWSAPLVARMPEVAKLVRMPLGHGEFKLRARYRLGRELRARRFARAIVLPGSFKSALPPWFARIPRRTGYVGEQRWGLLNDIRRLPKVTPPPVTARRFVALGRDKDAPEVDEIPRPALAVDSAAALQTAARFGLDAGAVAIALCPGAEYGPAKQWPPAHFAAVATAQLQRGRPVWIFGSAKDRAAAADINRRCAGRCADLTGRTTLGEAVDLLSLARHTVTNDSGLMHIAAAVGSHVIALYGSSSDTVTPPLTPRAHPLNLRLDCSPCFHRACPLGHTNCLNRLSPDRVLAVME